VDAVTPPLAFGQRGTPDARPVKFMGAIVEIFLLASALCGAVLWLAQHSIVIAVAATVSGAALLSVFFHTRCRAARQAASQALLEEINDERDQWQGLLAQHVPVLPLLASQLRGADQVEQAVGQVAAVSMRR
jgi:hypothetical protein